MPLSKPLECTPRMSPHVNDDLVIIWQCWSNSFDKCTTPAQNVNNRETWGSR